MAIQNSTSCTRGEFGTPYCGKGRSYGSSIVPSERAMVVSYKLSIVTIELSLTFRPYFPHQMSPSHNSTGGVSLWVKILGCSLGVMLGSTESEHPRLTNREIIFEEFSPDYATIPQRHGQTDGQTTFRSNSTLCVASRVKNICKANNCDRFNNIDTLTVTKHIKTDPSYPIQ